MSENFDVTRLLDALTTDISLALLVIMFVSFLFGILFGIVTRGKKIRQLKKELRMQTDMVEELKKKVEELTEEVDLKEADLHKANLELDDLRAKLQRVERDNNKLYSEMNTAKDTIKKLRNTNQTYADTIEGLTQEVSELKSQNTQLTNKLEQDDSAVSNIAEMQSLYGATRQKLEELEGKVNNLEVENTNLQSELGRIKTGSTTSDVAPDSFDEQAFRPNRSETAKVGGRLVTMRKDKDDLTLINGIGPFIEQKLNEAGVYTYEEISRWDNTTISSITKQIQFFPNRIQEDNWVEQAARLSQMKLENPEAFSRQAGTPSNPKDLKVIEGIGPKVEELLRTKGIRTWVELASVDVETLRSMLRDAGGTFNAIDPTSWPEQARLAANGEWGKLRQYQDYLIGGK